MEDEQHNDDTMRRLICIVEEQNGKVITTLTEHSVRLKTMETAVEELKESIDSVRETVDEIRLQRAAERGVMKGWLAASAALGGFIAWALEHVSLKGLFK
ncbi:MAG: hypothetical protein LBS53_13640 [Synergistaceae bacterium]|jgi:hypothetical protein|nr:hypothetical protein [Synergistaceae bacterium]